jgi:AcrR family transcriptional regulator
MVGQAVVATSSQEDLLDAATQAFLEDGFSGARVDAIARRAGVNKALIYYHFKSKRGLYQSVLVRLLRGVLDEVARVAASELDPRHRLIAFYAGVARVFAERPALPHLMVREIIRGGSRTDPEMANALGGILGFVSETVQQGIRAGSIRRVNPLVVHLTALAPLILYFTSQGFRNRMLPAAAPGLAAPTAEELLDHIALLIERGLDPPNS